VKALLRQQQQQQQQQGGRRGVALGMHKEQLKEIKAHK
jgi:hypothetical protein